MTRYSDQEYWKRIVVGAAGMPWLPEQCMRGSIFQIRERNKGRLMSLQMRVWMKYVRITRNRINGKGRIKRLKKTPTLSRILHRGTGDLFKAMVVFLSSHEGKYSGSMRCEGYENRRLLDGFEDYIYFDIGDSYLLLRDSKMNQSRISAARNIYEEIKRVDKLISLMKSSFFENGVRKYEHKGLIFIDHPFQDN